MSQKEEREAKLHRLRKALEIGDESGEDVDFSMEKLIAALPTTCIEHRRQGQISVLTSRLPENGCGGS